EPERSALGDGLTEELIHKLSMVRDLNVISSGTMFQYKDKRMNIRDVARELRASEIIEGSVRLSGNRVRTTVELTDASTGDRLWSARYERELTDMFALQDEIAQKIVSTLLVRFGARRSQYRGTADPEAGRLFQEGRALLQTLTAANTAEAL